MPKYHALNLIAALCKLSAIALWFVSITPFFGFHDLAVGELAGAATVVMVGWTALFAFAGLLAFASGELICVMIRIETNTRPAIAED